MIALLCAHNLCTQVGHLLGLLHTFETGQVPCDPDSANDEVEDTPVSTNAPGVVVKPCNPTHNTCPTLPGFDPVDNHMVSNCQGG